MDKGEELTAMARQALLATGRLEEFDGAVKRYDFPRLVDMLFSANLPENYVYLILFHIGKSLDKPLSEMIADRFSGEDVAAAKKMIADLSRDVGLRIMKCAAHYSRGDLSRLEEMVKLARLDYRDVIVMGEYEPIRGKLVRVRSFI